MQENKGNECAYILTTKAKIIKVVFNCALPLVYYMLCYLMGVTSILWIIPLTFILALAYTIPLIVTTNRIKNGNYKSIKPFIASDALYGLLPAVGVAFAVSLLLYIFASGAELIFMFALILSLMFVLITLYFWLSYYVNNTVVKRLFKGND